MGLWEVREEIVVSAPAVVLKLSRNHKATTMVFKTAISEDLN